MRLNPIAITLAVAMTMAALVLGRPATAHAACTCTNQFCTGRVSWFYTENEGTLVFYVTPDPGDTCECSWYQLGATANPTFRKEIGATVMAIYLSGRKVAVRSDGALGSPYCKSGPVIAQP